MKTTEFYVVSESGTKLGRYTSREEAEKVATGYMTKDNKKYIVSEEEAEYYDTIYFDSFPADGIMLATYEKTGNKCIDFMTYEKIEKWLVDGRPLYFSEHEGAITRRDLPYSGRELSHVIHASKTVEVYNIRKY